MTTQMTLNGSEEAKALELARWARITEDEARAHCLMVKEVIADVARRFGYHPNIVVGPQTWGESREQLTATGEMKARKGNGRRGKAALVAKYGQDAADNIVAKARAAR